MNITVAVSGGADSLFALLKLREEGHEVTALHARLLAPSGQTSPAADPVPGLQAACDRLGIPLAVADLTREFSERVIAPFARAHAEARTPNPCALCNRAIKFGLLLDLALTGPDHSATHQANALADIMATGHYAALERHPVYGLALRAGADKTKDQSYFLALVPAERLRRCVFPLAGERKADILAWLRRRGETPPLPAESQEICFVPGDDHRAFLRSLSGSALGGPGPVLLAGTAGNERVIGTHQGLWQYTEGQRKGLGIAWSEPLFVLRRDLARNALIVGPKDGLLADSCSATGVNLLVPPALWPAGLFARTRYRQAPVAATASVDGDRLSIRFAAPEPPVAPGQIAALYDADGFVLAGGVLE